jgi:hypothetical protein
MHNNMHGRKSESCPLKGQYLLLSKNRYKKAAAKMFKIYIQLFFNFFTLHFRGYFCIKFILYRDYKILIGTLILNPVF